MLVLQIPLSSLARCLPEGLSLSRSYFLYGKLRLMYFPRSALNNEGMHFPLGLTDSIVEELGARYHFHGTACFTR